jgi:fructosamine-3-kinase
LSQFRSQVAELMGVAQDRIERLAGGDLSEVLLLHYPDGKKMVAKRSMVAVEAAMLRAIAQAGVPTPIVEGEHESVLLLDHIENDGVFSPRAWADLGLQLRRLHEVTGELYGWPVDFAVGSVEISNSQTREWPEFWIEERLIATAALLDRPWRERVARAIEPARAILPASPRPALLHGDLWIGNILVKDGAVAALIDPVCYFGDREVDLAMLTLFEEPPPEFWASYGPLEPGADERRPVYQLFVALLHMRLHGAPNLAITDRLLSSLGA